MGDKKGENAMTEETMLMLVPAAALAIFSVALLFAVGFSKGGKVLGNTFYREMSRQSRPFAVKYAGTA